MSKYLSSLNRKILLVLLSCFVGYVKSQSVLWGMTSKGGTYNNGTIFSIPTSSTNFSSTYSFANVYPGSMPYSTNLVETNNGKLYGMTMYGGAYGCGVIFEYDSNNNIYTVKLEFDGLNKGKNPNGSLVIGNNGKLYGMTQKGGSNDYGVLFEYDPLLNMYNKKIDFDGTSYGKYPLGNLIQASNGIFYGLTSEGGINDLGLLFEYDISTNLLSNKFDFDGTNNGQNPSADLIQANNGLLYGMATNGGMNGFGTLFEFNLSTNIFTKKLDFDLVNTGGHPYGSLIQNSNGNLCGMTSVGGVNSLGVLFEFDLNTDICNKKVDFNGANGENPNGSLIIAANGKTFGMTSSGGVYGHGIIFEYDFNTNTYTKKTDFLGVSKGSFPLGSLVQSSNGKFYGLTSNGGAFGAGVLFEYDDNNDIYNKILEFSYFDGNNPQGSLMQASNGKIYGLTKDGGQYNKGVLFEYDINTLTYTKKIDFNTAIGVAPFGHLIQANDGNLYGMTVGGGAYNVGVIFQYDPNTNIYTKKFDFNMSNGDGHPFDNSMLQASNGKLYGITSYGGSNDYGVLFEYDITTDTYTKQLDFTGISNGRHPHGALIEATNGMLYGITQGGGANNMGVLYEFNPNTNMYTKKLDFSGVNNGGGPFSSLIQAINGKLYGMTNAGGTFGKGVLFEYDINTSICSKKIDFNTITFGSNPLGALIQSRNGKLYGLTSQGGNNIKGVLFEYDVTTNIFTKKINFNGTNGEQPNYTALIEICTTPTLNVVSTSSLLCSGQTSTLSASGANTFTWSTSENTANISISPSVTTTYSVTGGDIYGCQSTTSITQNVSICSGISSIKNGQSNVLIYPNPTNGLLNVDFDTDKYTDITILNSLGENVHQLSTHNKKSQLNLSNLINGVYVIKIITDHKQLFQQIVITK